MIVKLKKKFGLHEKDAEIDANDQLYKHLLKSGYIAKPKPKTKE